MLSINKYCFITYLLASTNALNSRGVASLLTQRFWIQNFENNTNCDSKA